MHFSYALPTLICFMQYIHLVLNMIPQYMVHSTLLRHVIAYLAPNGTLFISIVFIQVKYNTNIHPPYYNWL